MAYWNQDDAPLPIFPTAPDERPRQGWYCDIGGVISPVFPTYQQALVYAVRLYRHAYLRDVGAHETFLRELHRSMCDQSELRCRVQSHRRLIEMAGVGA